MRKKIYLKTKGDYVAILYILSILLFSNIFISNLADAQEEELILDITGESYEQIDEIFEGEQFLVSTYILSESGLPTYQVGVEVEFNGKIYQITIEDENFEINIDAPQVSEDTMFTVKASKTGFTSDSVTINVLDKPQLIIIPDGNAYTVEANKQFSVKVTDENGKPVMGATVGIQSCTGEDYIKSTDNNGRAWLVAPEGHSEITLIAQKDGYTNCKPVILGVNTNPGVIELLTENPYVPIFIAIVLLVLAILFVNLRQKKTMGKIPDRISKEQSSKRYNTDGRKNLPPSYITVGKTVDQYKSKENTQIEPKREPKVEEIRIHRSSKDKKIASISDESNGERKISPHKTIGKHDYGWFEGTNNIRYEIDKITGKIDEEGADKWFEGTSDIRAKIDEKVRKKNKEKNQ